MFLPVCVWIYLRVFAMQILFNLINPFFVKLIQNRDCIFISASGSITFGFKTQNVEIKKDSNKSWFKTLFLYKVFIHKKIKSDLGNFTIIEKTTKKFQELL